jgi:hypothetical protein
VGTLWGLLPEPNRRDVLRTLSMLVDRVMASVMMAGLGERGGGDRDAGA